MAKSKCEVAQAIRSGQHPPCIMYNVFYTVPENQRVNRAKLTVALKGKDLDLLFSCPIMEAVCEHCINMCMCLLYLCIRVCVYACMHACACKCMRTLCFIMCLHVCAGCTVYSSLFLSL